MVSHSVNSRHSKINLEISNRETQACTVTHAQARINRHTHKHVQTHTHTLACTGAYTRTVACTDTHRSMYRQTHIQACTVTQMHVRTETWQMCCISICEDFSLKEKKVYRFVFSVNIFCKMASSEAYIVKFSTAFSLSLRYFSLTKLPKASLASCKVSNNLSINI